MAQSGRKPSLAQLAVDLRTLRKAQDVADRYGYGSVASTLGWLEDRIREDNHA